MDYKRRKVGEGAELKKPYAASDEASDAASYMPKVTFNEFKESFSQSEGPVKITEQFYNPFASDTLSAVSEDEEDEEGNQLASVFGWDRDPTEESAAKTRQEIAEWEKKYYPEMSRAELKQVRTVEENTKKNKDYSVATKEFFENLREMKNQGYYLKGVTRIEDKKTGEVHYNFEWASIYIPEEQRAPAPQLSVKRVLNSQPKTQPKTQPKREITSASPDIYKKFLEYLGIFDRVQSAEKILIGYSNFPNEPRGGTKKRNKKSVTKRRKRNSTKKRKISRKKNNKKRKSIKRK
jgi:hypothetical protein